MDNKNEALNENEALRAQVSETPETPETPEAYPLSPEEATEETGEEEATEEKAVGPGPGVTTVQGPGYPL